MAEMFSGRLKRALFLVLLAFCLGTSFGCKPERPGLEKKEPIKVEEEDPVVANIGGYEVRLSEVKGRLEDLPVYVRLRHTSPESRREFLEMYVAYLALAYKAYKEGLRTDPKVVDAIKSEVVERYLRETVDSKVTTKDIKEEDIKAYYEAHIYEYVHGEQFEVRAVVVDDPEEAKRVAFRLRRRASPEADDPVAEFQKVYEAEGGKGDGVIGLFPWLRPEEPPLPKAVVEAAEKMKSLYDVSGPIEADGHYYVLYTARRVEPSNRSLEEARPEIVERLLAKERALRRKKFVEEALEAASVKINEDVFKAFIEKGEGRR